MPTSARPREREAIVEFYLTNKVRRLGGMTVKMVPTTPGVPDRLVMLPEGRLYLVELKAPHGQLSPVQVNFHGIMAHLGIPVAVLWSRIEVDDWLRDVTNQAYRRDLALARDRSSDDLD